MKEKGKKMTATPIVIPQSGGTAVGAKIDISDDTMKLSGGAIHSKGQTAFFLDASKNVSDSTSLGVNGNINTNGNYQLSGRIQYKW